MLYAAVGAISNEPEDSHVQTGTDARGVPGVIQVIRLEREIGDGFAVGASTLAVVARGYWLARQSLARMMPSGVHPGSAPTDSAAIVATHATAQFVEGRLRIWVANVDINPIRERAAHTSGLPEDHIDVRTVGHREGDCSAAVLAMAIWLARRLESAPVQAIVASDRALHLVPSAGPGTGVPMAA